MMFCSYASRDYRKREKRSKNLQY